MKIEETFRDAKGLMGLERVMSKSRKNLEALLGLMLLAYAAGVMLGEVVRDEVCRSKKGRVLLRAVHSVEAQAAAYAG